MTYTYRRNDAVGSVVAPDRGYEAYDQSGRLRAVVAGSGRSWTAGRVGPKRTARVMTPTTWAQSRDAAVRLLISGRP